MPPLPAAPDPPVPLPDWPPAPPDPVTPPDPELPPLPVAPLDPPICPPDPDTPPEELPPVPETPPEAAPPFPEAVPPVPLPPLPLLPPAPVWVPPPEQAARSIPSSASVVVCRIKARPSFKGSVSGVPETLGTRRAGTYFTSPELSLDRSVLTGNGYLPFSVARWPATSPISTARSWSHFPYPAAAMLAWTASSVASDGWPEVIAPS